MIENRTEVQTETQVSTMTKKTELNLKIQNGEEGTINREPNRNQISAVRRETLD